MKGYNSIKQFVQDYQLYRVAKKVDPGREGETLTSYLRKQIEYKILNATQQFRKMIMKKDYCWTDLILIGVHDSLRGLYSFEFFVRACFNTTFVSSNHYRKVLSSNAFKSGRLKRLDEFIPHSIQSKNDIIRFIKARRGVPKGEFSALMNQVCRANWRKWMNELQDKNKVQEQNGRWLA
jgi:hypothetical protein